MSTNKELPEWAVVGAEVLVKGFGYGDNNLSVRIIDRVTKTSVFLSDKSRFVASGSRNDKEFLEEYGSGQLPYRSSRSIQPKDGERAQYMIRRRDRRQWERDFDALLDAVAKTRRNHDVEAELSAVVDLAAGCVSRKAQLEEIVAEKIAEDRKREAEQKELARLRRLRTERTAAWLKENSREGY